MNLAAIRSAGNANEKGGEKEEQERIKGKTKKYKKIGETRRLEKYVLCESKKVTEKLKSLYVIRTEQVSSLSLTIIDEINDKENREYKKVI